MGKRGASCTKRAKNQSSDWSKLLRIYKFVLAAALAFPLSLLAQEAVLRTVHPLYMPAPVDSNSPAAWIDGQLVIFNSAGMPLVSRGGSQFLPFDTEAVSLNEMNQIPVWIEAVWLDEDGTLFAWYHHEPPGLCGPGSELTAPFIGAMVSHDGGRSFSDLGPVLMSGDALNCEARNGFFAGGHGDFSVIPDRNNEYFYFLFGNYGGDGSQQGVAVARMLIADRYAPSGNAWKYFQGEWGEAGLGGQVTPVFPVREPWQNQNTDAFWGPSLHWNTYLEKYVMLLSRACCDTRWPQKGIYVSYSADLADPASWSQPKLLLEDIGFGPGWYPQVLGERFGETDSVASRVARLYVHGVSHWEIEFRPETGPIQ